MIHFISSGNRALLDECDKSVHYLFLGAFILRRILGSILETK